MFGLFGRLRLTHALCTASFVAIAMSAPAYAQEETRAFDIPAQPLSSALMEYSRQADIVVVVPMEIVAGKLAPAVRGSLTPEAALERLLSGSGLIAQQRLEGGLTLVLAEAASPTQLGADSRAASREAAVEEEIVVTGTHVRGRAPVGAQVIVIDRESLDRMGLATAPEIIRTLPQNFAGGVNERLASTDTGAFNNNEGSAANLRGLGASSTLVLIDGRRAVPGGFAGAFVDIANIPTAAIERIEVLTDGASAIYGSDAIGGVVNFILRKDYDGAETRGRFGTFDGDADEISASQLFGTSWRGGNFLAGYQYYKREPLAMTERPFSANTDQRPRGGDNFSSPFSNPGNIISPFTGQPALAIPSGQDGTSLTVDDLLPGEVNFHNDNEFVDLLSEQELQSVFVNASQDVGQRLRVAGSLRYSERNVETTFGGLQTTLLVPESNPFFFGDPFGFGFPFTIVTYSFLDDFGVSVSEGRTENYIGTLAADYDLGSDWRLALGGSYGEEQNRTASPAVNFAALDEALADPDPATALNPFGDGSHTNPATLAAVLGATSRSATTGLRSIDVKADGPLFTLPGGEARLAIGAEYREEEFEQTFIGSTAGLEDVELGRGRSISALFAELVAPLVSPANSLPGVERLEISLAGRYEEYSDFGETFNPKVGLRWMPVESLTLRGTWGTSFRAPRLFQLDESPGANAILFIDVLDPQSPEGFSFALVSVGNNANIKEETASIWTAGMDFAPATNFRLSLTYFDIDYQDRIVTPGPSSDPFNILLEEDLWASLVTRNPSQAQIDALCSDPLFASDPELCALAPPTVIIDGRVQNIAATQMRGLDLNIEQTFDTGRGVLGFGLNGSYVFDFQQTANAELPPVEQANTVGNPLALRLRGTASWSAGPWTSAATINYADGYKDKLSEPARRVASWTTFDAQLAYRTSAGDDLMNDITFALSAVNLLDEDPPFVNQSVGFDPTNAEPYGRLLSLQITKAW